MATGKIYLGTSTISKMYLGQAEVSKVYLGQDLVYEKQASGFDVSITNRGSATGYNFYSLDGGTTWQDIGTLGNIYLQNVTQIMFKVVKNGSVWGNIGSTQLGFAISGASSTKTSQNYTLTQNITDVDVFITYD